MLALATTLLTLIEGIMPALASLTGTSAAVTLIEKAVAALITLVPVVASNFPNLLASVQNVIGSLQGNGDVTPDQVTALAALSAQIDAAFEANAAAAGDPAPPATS